MPFATYANLKTAVQTWLDPSDAGFTGNLDDMVTLFEACANRRLRVRQQLTTATITPDADGLVALPSDYLEWKRVTWLGSPLHELEYVEPDYLKAAYPDEPGDTPRVFSVEGANLQLMPVSTSNVELLYYQKVAALSGAVNWLYTTHPDVYFAGTLAEAAIYAEDMDKATLWIGRRDKAFDEIERLSQASRGQAQIRAYGPTP